MQKTHSTFFAVYYLRTVRKEISLPIAWYPTDTAKPHEIGWKLVDVLDVVTDGGIQIDAVICDGVASNRKFFKDIATTKCLKGTTYTALNPFAKDLKTTMFLIVDPSHLFKVSVLNYSVNFVKLNAVPLCPYFPNF